MAESFKPSAAAARLAGKIASMDYGKLKLTDADKVQIAEWIDAELEPLRAAIQRIERIPKETHEAHTAANTAVEIARRALGG